MKGKTAPLLPETDPDRLDMPPHVVPQLLDMVTGNWKLTPPTLEQLLAHLVECIHCQVFLGALIAVELHNDGLDETSREEVRRLLALVTRTSHETQAQEALGAYIEALESYSEAEASRKFPVLAEHLKRCKACQSSLEGTRTLLRRAEQTGLIAPLTLNKDE